MTPSPARHQPGNPLGKAGRIRGHPGAAAAIAGVADGAGEITGSDGDDKIYGGGGGATTSSGPGLDTIEGGSGKMSSMRAWATTISKGTMGPTIQAGDGNDVVSKVVGDDLIPGGARQRRPARREWQRPALRP
ncbi:MAG: hypothetical protein U1G07_27390 [Verrucomicrobiota bacterium]